MREAEYKRNTTETSISGSLVIDAEDYIGEGVIGTGIGFLDHMLTLLSKHGSFLLDISAEGDLEVDCHHTVEDVGIVVGKLFDMAAGSREGIARYGNSVVPMDDALVQVTVDFGGRPYLVFHADIPRGLLGTYDTEVTEDFFRALAFQCGMTLHINVLYGTNAHHMIEGIFKAFARALRDALTVDGSVKGILSTKGQF